MNETPPELLKNPHFVRYFNTWQKNPASIVFIPLAEIYREKGHYEEAREVCLKGLETHPQSVGGMLTLARIHYDQENYAGARTWIEKILAEIPGQKEAQTLLERVNAASVPVSPVRSEITPSVFDTCTMAEVYAQQGEVKTALTIVKKILGYDPANDRARSLEAKWSAS